MKLSIIIPVYNEAACVPETTDLLRSTLNYLRKTYKVEVVIVDDGSTDDTADLLRQADLPNTQIISHAENQGVGVALRTGFENSTGDIIITTDFDGTYPFTAIPQLVARMVVDQADIAIASPYHRNGSTRESTGHHVLLEAGISLLYRTVVNRQIRTWTSLFCAYRRHVLERLTIREGGVIASTELLVGATKARFKIVEIPVNLRKRPAGRSRSNAIRLMFSHLAYIMQLPMLRPSRLQKRIKLATPISSPSIPAPVIKEN
jgi:dolichol-phosphate mannosyltransferase